MKKGYLNALLRRALAGTRQRKKYKFRWMTVKGLLKPGVDVADRNALYELMEGWR